MAETNPQPEPTPNPPATGPEGLPEAAQPAKKPQPTKAKKRRKWPWVLVILLLLILLLVAMVPTIVSSGMGRSIIVSQVNQRINGRLEMQDLSLGWTRPIHADGIVIFDASGRQILQLPHFETGLTLINAVRGNYALGKTEIDGLDVLVSRDANGTLNWSQLAKPTEPKKPEAEPNKAAENKGPSKLPSVSGELIVKNANITYEDRSPEHQPPVFVRALNADVKIPSINETITDTLSAEARIGSPNAKPGTLSVDGSVAAVQNNVLALNSANVSQTIKLKDLSNAAISSVLGPNLKLEGQTDGQVVLQLSNGTNGTVQMLVQSNGFSARGATLNGARLTSDGLTIALPKTTITVPQGIDHPENAKLQIGDGKANAFTVTLKNASVIQGEGATARKVISSDTLTVLTACDVSTSAQGKDLKLTQFKIGDEQGIVAVAKDPSEDVAVTLPAQGNPAARGKVDLNADLKRLNDALQAMQGAQVVATDKKGMELKSGLLKGTIGLAQANAQQIQLNGDINLTQITVGDDQTTPINNDSLTLSLQALSNHDASQVEVPTLKVAGNLFGLTGKDIRLKLSNGSDPKAPPVGMLDKLQQADIRVEVPSLPNLQTFSRAFSPPKKTARLNPPGPAFAYAGKVPPDVAPVSQPPKPELPPADLTSGSATLTLLVNSNGHQTEMRPGATITNLALKRGDFAYSAGDITLSTIVVATPAPTMPGTPAPSGLNGIQQLTVSNLTLNAPTLKASASLAQPIEIKDPGGLADVFSPPAPGAKPRSASVNGRIHMTGELEPLIALNQAMSGEKAAHQMAGGFALDEGFDTDPSGTIGSKGQVDLTNLTVDGQADPEKAFRISNDVALNSAAKLLAMNNVNIKATTTNCLDLTLKGKISDLGGKQQIQDQLTADLAYDLAPLWQVLQPLMSAEQRKSYADVQVAGKYQKQFVVTGAYPSGKPFNEAVQSVAVWGSLQFDDFLKKSAGIELKNAELPIDLQGGVARVQYHGKPEGQNLPPPMSCNDGKINLGGIAIDLKTQHTLVTTPKKLQLLDKVSLNPALASWGLGDYLNNPLFVGAKEATGQLSLVVQSCDGLAVDDLGKGIGSAVLDMSIGTLQLGNPDLAKVVPQSFLNSLRGEVPSYHVTIEKGMLNQNFTLALLQAKRELHLTGDVNLATKQMEHTTLIFPWSLFALKNKQLDELMPEGVQIPLKGQSNSPIPGLDVNQLLQQNAGKALQNLFHQGKNNNQSANQPNGKEDPLKGLMDLLNKNKNQNNPSAQQQPPMQQQPPAQNQPDQDPAKALEDLINGNHAGNNNNPNAPATQPVQQPQQQEDPIKALTDLFKKKKK